MRRHILLASIMLMAAMTVSACTGTRQAEMNESDKAYGTYGAPMSIYSVMDSTSLVYSDPAAASPINDSPIRWLGFLLHPVGQAIDYGINRPLYSLSNQGPFLFGYTTEDSMLDTQRK